MPRWCSSPAAIRDALGTDPPRRRARAGRGRAGAVPRHAGDHRPGDRERLLLRFRTATSRSPPRTSRRSRRRCARSSPATRSSSARCGTATKRSSSSRQRGERFKAELIQRPAGNRSDHAVQPGRLDRPVPRPAHARHRRRRHRVQADEGGRRLLARRSPQPDAVAHLRHRLARPEGARRLPDHAGGGREARPPPHRPATWACSTSRKRRSAACSGTRRAGRLYRAAESYMRRRLDAAGYQEVKTPQLVDRALWEASGHWEKFREHMFIAQVPDEDKVLALKPMNCPCHVQIFQPGPAQLPRAAAAHGGIRRLPPLRAVGRAARHHAGARVHPGRRAHLLHRGPDRAGNRAVRGAAGRRSTATSASRSSG